RAYEVVDVAEVSERLDPARRRARADRDEHLRLAAHALYALGVVRRRDRPFDEREVVGAADDGARGLRKVRDLDLGGDGEQLVLAVEQAQLAAVARRELPD